ncbi:MAG: universal stress protein [Kineosporiaceae bacterium]
MESLYGRIACCIDRDPMAKLVVAEGLRLAGGDPAALSIVHVVAPAHALGAGPYAYVVPIQELRGEAEEWVGELARGVPAAARVVLDGLPGREVCAWAQAEGVDLIVASAHRGLVERAFLGGFASYLAYHAPCAVLLVRPRGETPDHLPAAEATRAGRA